MFHTLFRATTLGAVATALALSSFVGISTTYAQDTLGISPLIIEKTLQPGTTWNDVVKITNRGTAPVKVQGSVADFYYDNSGQMQFVDETEPTTSAASLKAWLRMPKEETILQAGETKEYPVTVEVPTDAEPGGHYGVFFMNTIPADDAQLKISGRVGALVLIEVPGDIQKTADLTFLNVGTVESLEGRNILRAKSSFDSAPIGFEYRLKNTGNVHFIPEGEFVIKNMFGSVVERFPAQLAGTSNQYRSFPGVERSFYRTWEPGFLLGKYTAELTIKDGSGKTLPMKTVTFSVMPWTFIGGAVLVLLILISLIVTLLKAYNGRAMKKAHHHKG